MNRTKSNQTEFTLLVSKFKRRKATAQFDSCDKTTGFEMLGKTGGGKRFLQIKKRVAGVKFCPKLSAISRQLFRSRFRCCACIFPSGKKRKNAVNLLSISATQHPRERLWCLPCCASGSAGACCRQRADRSPGWGNLNPDGNISVKVCCLRSTAPFIHKAVLSLSPPPPTEMWAVRLIEGDDACQPVLFFFLLPRFTTQFTHS